MTNPDKPIVRMLRSLSHGEWEHLILDREGCVCGSFRAAIRNTEQELRDSFNFEPVGGFQRYVPHIAAPKLWPMAVLERIDINKEKQRMGYGRKGLSEFYAQ